ncbi:methyltransferase domain-containing protein [Candidatus Wolfebacteria bacterium]|nr:methyltransferase domain-containing protein [Candidatus Wolfebacteria bacterium]
MFKKKILKIAIPFLSFIVKNRRIKIDESRGDVLVNLGCGLRCLPHWINIDGSLTAFLGLKRFNFINKLLYKLAGSSAHYSFKEFNNIIKNNKLYFYDLRRGAPFFDESVDVIYASHFLEHLAKNEAKKFIQECRRILKKNGLIRLAVPDLDIAFKMYQKGKVEEMLDSFFYTSDAYDFHMHKYNYNFQTLKKLLEEINFSQIKKQSYQKGECPDINFLDVYPDHSLYIEAKK